jgi:hypothetical protein
MAKPNKTAGPKNPKDSGPKGSKAIADVAHPGMSAPSDTSKSIITHRPMMRDPMVVEEGEKQTEDEAGLTPGKLAGETKITPLSEQKDDEPDAAATDAAGTDDKDDAKTADKADKADSGEKPAEPKADDTDKPGAADASDAQETAKDDDAEAGDKPGAEASQGKDKTADDAKAAAQAEEDAKTSKLIESKKYFLPINAVEHRRSTQIAVMGVILALILAVAWVDVALDAGLIHLGGIKPVTHIFSN